MLFSRKFHQHLGGTPLINCTPSRLCKFKNREIYLAFTVFFRPQMARPSGKANFCAKYKTAFAWAGKGNAWNRGEIWTSRGANYFNNPCLYFVAYYPQTLSPMETYNHNCGFENSKKQMIWWSKNFLGYSLKEARWGLISNKNYKQKHVACKWPFEININTQ